MHAEDEADDQLIADQLKTQVITRSQSQAAERAQQNPLIPSDTRQQARVDRSSKKGATAVLAPNPLSASTDCLDIPMSEMQELSLAHAFVTHKIPVTLPVHYNPAGMPTPKGEVVVVAVKAQKQTSDKATVRVEFLSPPSHAGKQIQLYPKSLEPKNGPVKEADFSLLTAVKALFPHATTWRDLGVETLSNSHSTVSALAALAAYSGGECFAAVKLADSGMKTSERSPAHLHSLAEGEEDESANSSQGTRGVCKIPNIAVKCFAALSRTHGSQLRNWKWKA